MRHINRFIPVITVAAVLAIVFAVQSTQAAPSRANSTGGRPTQNVSNTACQTGPYTLPDATFVASVVGVSRAMLLQELAAGTTLLQIAGSKYASANDLATALLVNLKMKLNYGVRSGGLTQAQADAVYNQAHDAFARLVVMPHPPMEPDQGVSSGGAGKGSGSASATPGATPGIGNPGAQNTLPPADYVASVVGVSTQVLQQDLAAGKTLVQIAGSKFASADDLATALLVNVKMKLDRGVADGAITSADEARIYSQLHDAYVQMVTMAHPPLESEGPAGGGPKSKGNPGPTPGPTGATGCSSGTAGSTQSRPGDQATTHHAKKHHRQYGARAV